MSNQIASCPECSGADITTNTYQVRCRACGWSVQEPDPRYVAHREAIGPEGITFNEPLAEAIDALPADFADSLTTTRSALPADHPANAPLGTSMTAAEFRLTREAFGLSAEWLAERLGVALKTVQRWESGHRLIPDGVSHEIGIIATAVGEGAARPCAERLLTLEDPVMTIPRTGTHCGFPASWYRGLVESTRHVLKNEFGDAGERAASFRVVYFDEVGDQS